MEIITSISSTKHCNEESFNKENTEFQIKIDIRRKLEKK